MGAVGVKDAGQRIGGDCQGISSFIEVRVCQARLVGCLIDEREALMGDTDCPHAHGSFVVGEENTLRRRTT